MPYVTLLEATQIVRNETGIDITVPQLIRAGATQNLLLCVLLDVKCYSPTHRIRRENKALELDPDYWSNCPLDQIDDADVVDAYGLFVLPPRHVFAYQTKETVRVDSVTSLDGQDIYYPGVDVSRDALQITLPHLDALIGHIKAAQAAENHRDAAAASQPMATPEPKGKAPETAEKHAPLQRAQEDAILGAISDLGYTPDALPSQLPGKSGVKAEVRKKLKSHPLFKEKSTVFDKAWERLREFGDIADE